jgi:hypothetical protein
MSQSDACQQQERLPHSKCGIFSFILAILSPFVLFVFMLLWLIPAHVNRVESKTWSTETVAEGNEHAVNPIAVAEPVVPEPAVFVFLFLFPFALMPFVALVLGIVGVCQPHTRKVFSILGIVFSGLTIVCPMILVVIAMIFSFVH